MTRTDDAKPAAPHTPEPWYIQPSDYPGGLLIKPIPGQVIAQCDQVPEMEANARRIVAAVNACQGISSEALEQGAVAEMLNALLILEKRCKALGWSEPLMRIMYHAIALATWRAA
jgi:hypothetical protein